jgi:hypothetical protein
VVVGIFGARVAAHFGGPPVAWDFFDYAGSAGAALADPARRGLRGLELIQHINKEVIHHGAEVFLLRDLYQKQG